MATRIMVVDDEPAIGKLLMYQLTGFGYQVSYFQDGLEALQRLPAARPDLVILDVMMPLISGWEICREIRACSAVPIIMLTAKGADADIVTGLGAGADDYVTKPFSMTQLQARIEAVLRRATHNPSLRAITRTPPRADPHLLTQPSAVAQRAARITPAATQAVRAAVDEEAHLSPGQPTPHNPPADATPLRLGQHMRDTRMARGMPLHQVERAIKVRWEFLQAIEQENWSYVPRHELRRALNAYAEYLGLDLRALIGQPKLMRNLAMQRGCALLFPLQFAAALAVVMVLVVVVYLF